MATLCKTAKKLESGCRVGGEQTRNAMNVIPGGEIASKGIIKAMNFMGLN